MERQFNMGGEVPATYYLSNNGPVAKDYMETITIIAGAGGRKKMKYKVDVASSILKLVVNVINNNNIITNLNV